MVQTYSGYEKKVRTNLEQRIASMHMEDRIFSVLVPEEEKVYVKDGKTKRVHRKVFPSYVLVEMILEDQSWYVVRHTPGVTGFVGNAHQPIPLTLDEVYRMLAPDLAPAVVLGTRPVNTPGGRRNEAFAWDAAGGYRAAHTKYYLPDEADFWEASWYARGDGRFDALDRERFTYSVRATRGEG